MNFEREEKEDINVWDEFPEAVMLCLICKNRPIKAENIQTMLHGGRCVCTICGAIHKVVGGEIGIWGFRV